MIVAKVCPLSISSYNGTHEKCLLEAQTAKLPVLTSQTLPLTKGFL